MPYFSLQSVPLSTLFCPFYFWHLREISSLVCFPFRFNPLGLKPLIVFNFEWFVLLEFDEKVEPCNFKKTMNKL